MNIAELKLAWNEYDNKIKSVSSLNEKIILSMIKERSSSRLSRIETLYLFSIVSNIFWVLIILAVFFTNPFDFNNLLQYTPMAVVALCLIVLTGISVKSYSELKKIEIHNASLEESLKKVIPVLEKPWKHIKKNILFMMIAAILFPLSFLPQAIESAGLWPALAYELTPMIVVALVIYFLSLKTGIFKERYADKFKIDLEELNELKSISTELLS